jgi:hypothetical protein
LFAPFFFLLFFFLEAAQSTSRQYLKTLIFTRNGEGQTHQSWMPESHLPQLWNSS